MFLTDCLYLHTPTAGVQLFLVVYLAHKQVDRPVLGGPEGLGTAVLAIGSTSLMPLHKPDWIQMTGKRDLKMLQFYSRFGYSEIACFPVGPFRYLFKCSKLLGSTRLKPAQHRPASAAGEPPRKSGELVFKFLPHAKQPRHAQNLRNTLLFLLVSRLILKCSIVLTFCHFGF